jgi:uncharacterized membrane protein YfcA
MKDAISFFEVSLIILIATSFRTAFGFGEALIAVPLLSLLLPVKVATPVAVLASIVIALVIVIREREHIHFAAAKKLLLATICGLPLGLLLLRYGREEWIKAVLGILLLAFSVFSLVKPRTLPLKKDSWVWFFGFLAGVTGGSYGMNGPPLVIYGAAKSWSPRQFRATLQAYFLPASLLGMVGYAFSGVWTKEVSFLFLATLPAVMIGLVLGNLLTRRMESARFTRFLYGGLILVACVLIFQAF